MKIVVTEPKLPDDRLICQCCGTTIAHYINEVLVPSFTECYKKGNIPVPNFGWICSQECAERFEKENDINFARTLDGKIDYYNGSLK